MKDFHEAFSTESWNQLHRTDKFRHVVLKCKECVKSHPEFKLKKINIEFTRTVLSSEALENVLRSLRVNLKGLHLTQKNYQWVLFIFDWILTGNSYTKPDYTYTSSNLKWRCLKIAAKTPSTAIRQGQGHRMMRYIFSANWANTEICKWCLRDWANI
jgi:hypothetical protein